MHNHRCHHFDASNISKSPLTSTHMIGVAFYRVVPRVCSERGFALLFRRDVVVACFRAGQAVFGVAHEIA